MDKVELIRSRRRTLGLEVTREGRVIVRVPLRASAASIERFVREHAEWIQKAQARQRARLAAHPEPDEAGQAVLMRRAREELPHGAAADGDDNYISAHAFWFMQPEKPAVFFVAADGLSRGCD